MYKYNTRKMSTMSSTSAGETSEVDPELGYTQIEENNINTDVKLDVEMDSDALGAHQTKDMAVEDMKITLEATVKMMNMLGTKLLQMNTLIENIAKVTFEKHSIDVIDPVSGRKRVAVKGFDQPVDEVDSQVSVLDDVADQYKNQQTIKTGVKKENSILDDVAALYKKHGSTEDQDTISAPRGPDLVKRRLQPFSAAYEGDSERDSEGPYIDPAKSPLEYIKLISFYWAMFSKIKLPDSFIKYDTLIKFILDVEDKFLLHGVNSKYKVEMFLKLIEGTETMREFFRFSKGMHQASATDIRMMTWSTFKKEFISHFVEKGSWNKIFAEMSSWTVKTFKSSNDAINGYEMLIRILREINMVNGKGITDVVSLSKMNLIHFLHTIPADVYNEVIHLMDMKDGGIDSTKDIHDLEYEELVVMLKKLEANKLYKNSIYGKNEERRRDYHDKKKENNAGSDQGEKKLTHDEVALERKKNYACYGMMNENYCAHGDACRFSHEASVITEFKRRALDKKNNSRT